MEAEPSTHFLSTLFPQTTGRTKENKGENKGTKGTLYFKGTKGTLHFGFSPLWFLHFGFKLPKSELV
jgi:hypothetical protein